MSNYRRLPSCSGSEEFEEIKHVDAIDESSKSSSSSGGSRWINLSVQVYIAVIATIICLIQLSYLWRSDSIITRPTIDTGNDSIKLQYSRNYNYMSLDHQFDHLWEFGNFSTLSITEPELGTGEKIDAAISMFHQLHCLSSFRTALQDAREGQQVAFDWRHNGHWPHCLDYLRNTFLCFADGTLELPRIVDGKRAEFIDGAQDVRKCKSNKALFERQGLTPLSA